MTEEIRTYRTPKTKDRPYFSMSRATAQDRTLSFEARGMLAYLLSKPDDWQVVLKDLQQKCGRDKARAILKELEDHRYIVIEHPHDSKGHFAKTVYRIHETPWTENPSTDSPATANPTLTNNREVPQSKDGQQPPSGGAPDPNAETGTGRPRDLIFDAVALGSFGLRQVKDKLAGGRIAKVSNWLKNQENVTAERVQAFYSWYTENSDGASPPRDISKFAVWWAKFDDRDASEDDPYAAMFADGKII